MNKFIWMLKQLLPLSYVSEYSTNGHREVAVWHMWLGRCFNVKRWTVA
jgi:hypothetical protein